MFTATTIAILLTMSLAIERMCIGPTIYDRILAVNMFGTKTVLLIAVLGYLTGRPDFLDIALVYALINFIGTIAVLKFLRYGGFGDTHEMDTQDVDNKSNLSDGGPQ
jgi:multicomponent Na+:H+ antiporter subunit F